jgi:hypothetical protein
MLLKVLLLLLLELNATLYQRNLYERWEEQVEKFLYSDGRICYSEWKKHKHDLAAYLRTLADHPPQPYWIPADRKAYWINVYNAATIALVLEHFPLRSLMEVSLHEQRIVFTTPKRDWSLLDIERQLCSWKDPRVLLALHRATVSGPDLAKEAYRSSRLEQQLDDAARRFLQNSKKNQCKGKTVQLSRLLLWNNHDFGSPEQQLLFLKKYGCESIQEISNMQYLPYDPTLNKR